MIGRRIDCPFGNDGALLVAWPEPGDFWRDPRYGGWCASTPNGHLANLSAHQVTEHEDRTITVSPSILVGDGDNPNLWHGYLERGVWRAC